MGKNEENPDSKYGKAAEFDPNFHGPIHNRGCTDIICCLIFTAVVLSYLGVGGLAFYYGDPRHVLYPKNSTGAFCGTGDNRDRPYLFYFDVLKCIQAINIIASTLDGLQCPTTQVCVDKCPNEFWAAMYTPGASPANVFNQSLCVPYLDLSTTSLTVSQILERELCPSFYVPSYPVVGRCLPDFTKLNDMPPSFANVPGLPSSVEAIINSIKNGTGSLLSGFNNKQIGVRVFEDFASSWHWILLCLLIAMAVSLLFLLLLRFIAPIMVWVLIFGVLAAVAYAIVQSYWKYTTYKKLAATISDIGLTTSVNSYLSVKETWLAALIILCFVELILILTLIFLRTRIRIAIALIQEASISISYMMSTLVFPVITFALLMLCILYWGLTALYLATSGDPVYKVVALNATMSGCEDINGTVDCDPENFDPSQYPSCPSVSCIFVEYSYKGHYKTNISFLQFFNAMASLWVVNFVIALGQCSLAGAFASYYWAFNKSKDIPRRPLLAAFLRSLRYHVGSLAFGALILATVQMIRVVLQYIDKKTKGSQNKVARYVMRCLKCCFWCLEKFIKFLNRNAYIMIAIYGKNFCVSAKNAFMLLMRNAIRVVVLDKVTDLLLFFGKLLVVGGVGILSFYFFSGKIVVPEGDFHTRPLNYYWMPIFTVALGSYFIAHGFFSVYNMCVDTLFLCFLEDLERNDGSAEKPYLMSENLKKILNKSNKTPVPSG